jgi:4-diphosphocytidyl-2-C-methyl-D-erythritol kinase
MKIRRNGSPQGTPGPIIPEAGGGRPVHILAPAKINLYLEVLGKRPDGYHEIETLILAVELNDEIHIAPDETGRLRLTCDAADLSAGDDNLVLQAARLLRQRTGCTRGASIGLEKRIPWAAGLGGGSSDAAATLAGLNELWELGLSTDQLALMGAELGSDVPFFFHAPAAVCTGRGEKVKPVAAGRAFDIVLVKPPMGLNTAEVYREQAAQQAETAPPGSEAAVAALKDGDVEALGRALHNRLQAPAMRMRPALAELHQRMQRTAPAGCLMSGSGSCLFALCRDRREAEQVADDLRRGWLPGDPLAGTRTFTALSCT